MEDKLYELTDPVLGTVKIRVRSLGRGRPVLLLHGWLASGDLWLNLSRWLKEDYRFIIPDLPGFGDSPPLRGKGCVFDNTAKVLRLLISELTRTEPLYGIVAYSLSGLFLLDISGKGADFTIARSCFCSVPTEGISMLKPFVGNEFITTGFFKCLKNSPGFLKKVIVNTVKLVKFRNTNITGTYILKEAFRSDPATVARLLKTISFGSYSRRVAPPTLGKVLVTRGERELVVRKGVARRLSSDLGGYYYEFKGATHIPMLETPIEFNNIIGEFLGGAGDFEEI
jgi:pimeloyl-ACP methyl ester carboxylesterase